MSDDEIPVCPKCDGAHIRRRTPDHSHSHIANQRRWYCQDCGVRVDDVVWREPRSTFVHPEGTSQRALLDADPEEVLGDD